MKKDIKVNLILGLSLIFLYFISVELAPLLAPNNLTIKTLIMIVSLIILFFGAIKLNTKYNLGLYVGQFKKRYYLYIILGWILIIIFNLIGLSIFPNNSEPVNEQALKGMANESLLITTFYTAVVAPIAEELIFRGCIIGLVFKNKKWLGLIVSILTFTMIHSPTSLQTAWPYMIMGTVFGSLYIITENLKVSTGAHLLNNVIASIKLFR